MIELPVADLESALAESEKLVTHYKTLIHSPSIPRATEGNDDLRRVILCLRIEQSVRVQSFLAKWVNELDGGRRKTFRNADAWITRLRRVGFLKPPTTDH